MASVNLFKPLKAIQLGNHHISWDELHQWIMHCICKEEGSVTVEWKVAGGGQNSTGLASVLAGPIVCSCKILD